MGYETSVTQWYETNQRQTRALTPRHRLPEMKDISGNKGHFYSVFLRVELNKRRQDIVLWIKMWMNGVTQIY